MGKRITIDHAGRVVIPKPLRDHFGLHAGSDLDVDSEGDRIVLEPVASEAAVTERGGILVIASTMADEPTDLQTIRGERLDRLAGRGS
ncbi:MAG TPA: AbrB/MazE/SpoVT family DNA-binding domain-containing protein [Thermoanaerobaculia bacterium]|nr:AbrB/MazE/SpoVT family DNA-binding domain-containing protein [Thermoanaerobaculia bacterium]